MSSVSNESKKIAEGVLSYLKKNKKEALLAEIVEILSKKQSLKAEKVILTTPVKLNLNQKKRANTFALSLIDKKSAKFVYEIDPRIIDGMKIRYGDKIWDLSLIGELSEISGNLS